MSAAVPEAGLPEDRSAVAEYYSLDVDTISLPKQDGAAGILKQDGSRVRLLSLYEALLPNKDILFRRISK